MDIIAKIDRYLNEGIDSDDKKGLINAIEKGKPIRLQLDSIGGDDFLVTGSGNKVRVEYEKNTHPSLEKVLIAICKEKGFACKKIKGGLDITK